MAAVKRVCEPNTHVNPRMPREWPAKYQPNPLAAYVGLNRLLDPFVYRVIQIVRAIFLDQPTGLQ